MEGQIDLFAITERELDIYELPDHIGETVHYLVRPEETWPENARDFMTKITDARKEDNGAVFVAFEHESGRGATVWYTGANRRSHCYVNKKHRGVLI